MANDHIESLAGLDRGQSVRLAIEDGTELEVRVNQFDYVPEEHLQIELAADKSGEYEHYQALASFEGGEWSPVEVRGYHSEDSDWTTLGDVSSVMPLEDLHMQEADETGRQG